MLLTPSLISLLYEDDPFIPDLIRQVFGQSPKQTKVDVVVGVVDRISRRPGNGSSRGSEGLSLRLSPSLPTIPCLWSTTQENLEQSTRPPQQQRTLSFQIVRGTLSFQGMAAASDVTAAIRTLDLPLANTVFLNGRTSTLFAQRWVVNPTQGSGAWLVREKHKALDRQVVCLFERTRYSHLPRLDMPPYRIPTPPRVIDSSMGNIIRTFRNYPAPTPASAEIEKALPSWGPGPSSTFEIWAQIIPRERWSGLPQLLGNPSDVDQGHRFHKVLSSGGGWGNKQGLIALDPDSNFERTEERVVYGDGEDPEAEQRRALGEVARPGDVVRFVPFLPHPLRTRPRRDPKGILHVGTSVRIGSIPSQKHEQLQQSTQQGSKFAKSDFFVDVGHFGALSETGLSMHVQIPSKEENQPLQTIVQTKLPPSTSYTWSQSSIVLQDPEREEVGKPSVYHTREEQLSTDAEGQVTVAKSRTFRRVQSRVKELQREVPGRRSIDEPGERGVPKGVGDDKVSAAPAAPVESSLTRKLESGAGDPAHKVSTDPFYKALDLSKVVLE